METQRLDTDLIKSSKTHLEKDSKCLEEREIEDRREHENPLRDNNAVWSRAQSSPLMERLYEDGNRLFLIKTLEDCIQSAHVAGLNSDPRVYDLQNELERARLELENSHSSTATKGDLTQNHYDKEVDEKKIEALIARPESGNPLNSVIIIVVVVSLRSIETREHFDQSVEPCKRIRQGLERLYERFSLKDSEREYMERLVLFQPTVDAIYDSLSRNVSQISHIPRVVGLVTPLMDMLSLVPPVEYRRASESQMRMNYIPSTMSPLRLGGFDFEIDSFDHDSFEYEPLQYTAVHFQSIDSNVSDDDVSEPDNFWEENFSIETTDSLEQSFHQATTMDNSLFNPETRECLMIERNENLSAIKRIEGEMSPELLMGILLQLSIDISICLGLNLNDIYELQFGSKGRISKSGQFHRHVRMPNSIYHPEEEIADQCLDTVNRFEVDLPPVLAEIIEQLDSEIESGATIGDLLGCSYETFEDLIRGHIESICDKHCMNTIHINQLPHQLEDFMGAIGESLENIFWLVGKKQYRSPTQYHYNATETAELSRNFYLVAVEKYYEGYV